MSNLKYFYDLMSQPSRTLYIFLKLTNIPYEACPIALRKREHLSDEFKQHFSRFQKVPFIHHGDFKLSESVAIACYLTREYRDLVADNWYPRESKAQAQIDEYLAWHHVNTRMPCASYFFHKYLLPVITGSPPDKDVIVQHESNMENSLSQIEELWLSSGPFLVGDTISLADIFAACEIEQLRMAGYDPTKGRLLLKAWLDRVRNTCNPVYDEAHAVVNKIAAKTKAKL